jgi:large subunit ribosomal protein L13
MKTYAPRKADLEQAWWLVNAEGKILGRLATQIATLLRGKDNPRFARHVDTGAFVIVVNAEKIKVTGRKLGQKAYYHHSQFPGGIKEQRLEGLLATKPEEVIRKAVWGMIPKNRLGRAVYKKLKVYRGPQHPHEAQQPREYAVK